MAHSKQVKIGDGEGEGEGKRGSEKKKRSIMRKNCNKWALAHHVNFYTVVYIYVLYSMVDMWLPIYKFCLMSKI